MSLRNLSLGDVLRREPVAGALLAGAATVGLVSANAPSSGAYAAVTSWRFGPASLHLDLTLRAGAPTGCSRCSSSSPAGE